MSSEEIKVGQSRDHRPHVHAVLLPTKQVWMDIVYHNATELDMVMTALLDHFYRTHGKEFVAGLRRWARTKEQRDLDDLLRNLEPGNFNLRRPGATGN